MIEASKYKISVVMPIYNVENYLEEAIESVIGQTVGFEDNIQLILVNDGSTDSSGDICKRYAEEFPGNIVNINKENGGVSSARNEGIKHTQGQYLIFLDADDFWESNAFEIIYDFIEDNNDQFDVCSCKMNFAGDREGNVHPLDDKFNNGRRVVDLLEEPDVISSTIGNVVIRRSAIEGIRFNEKISAGEDSVFVNSVLLRNPHLGIIPDAIFHYRRNYGSGSGSTNAHNMTSWYTQVPAEYYLGLFHRSIELFGEVLPFIQYVIMYDLRWRKYNFLMMDVLTDIEKEQHLAIMREVLAHIKSSIIRRAKGLTQYKKLYLYRLKYGDDITERAVVKDNWLVYSGIRIFNFRASSTINVSVFEFEEGELYIEGTTRISAIGGDYCIAARDNKGLCYKADMGRYEKIDVHGFLGELVARGERFSFHIPLQSAMQLEFLVITRGQEVKLKPSFDRYLSIRRDVTSDYCFRGGYIVKYSEGTISLVKDTFFNRRRAEVALQREITSVDDPDYPKLHKHELRLHKIMTRTCIEDKIAFITSRADGKLLDNMQILYDKIELPKEYLAKKEIHMDHSAYERAMEMMCSSRVIVTDNYLHMCQNYRLRPGQHLVQLWHATGAFKHFGKDSGSLYPGKDRLFHRDYELVTVSSEGVRQIYADCFDIPVSRVAATGVARTDLLFDNKYRENTIASVYRKHPGLIGKKVILYAPTFRDGAVGRKVFRPELDFSRLSEAIRDDQIFVLCPHPIMTEPIIRERFDNVIEIRDISTSNMMLVADKLVTDYSSIMFEYALLGRPIIFYCYDYYTYERDFYLDMDTELPGPIITSQEDLHRLIREDCATDMISYRSFCEKYLGACDGHSTDRIISRITKMFYNN